MNSIIIDTNPLVYIYTATPGFGKEYAELLGKLAGKNILLIPKVVYGELSLIFRNDRKLNAFLIDTGIVIGEMKPEMYITAADRWEKYNKRRTLMCHNCGNKLERLICKKCKSVIKIRQHILTDFLIGAYALHLDGQTIVTNDKGYYSSYFPELNITTVE